MGPRKYFSSRVGALSDTGYDLPLVKRLFMTIYEQLEHDDFLQQALGYFCVDQGDVPGTLGRDVGAMVLRRTRKMHLWPIGENIESYVEEDLFDVIEFLHDHVSKPIERPGDFHSYSNCGYHFGEFNKSAGQKKFREELNQILEHYNQGYRISDAGEIEALGDSGLRPLLEAPLTQHDPVNVEDRVRSAVQRFRRYHSSLQDRRAAVRELSDVLEFLRPQIKAVLTDRDESDLFNLANNFAIRHHNPQQKSNYDKDIWYRWMFYYYLATIHASLRLLEKSVKPS